MQEIMDMSEIVGDPYRLCTVSHGDTSAVWIDGGVGVDRVW